MEFRETTQEEQIENYMSEACRSEKEIDLMIKKLEEKIKRHNHVANYINSNTNKYSVFTYQAKITKKY
jgi:hypothetical protein